MKDDQEPVAAEAVGAAAVGARALGDGSSREQAKFMAWAWKTCDGVNLAWSDGPDDFTTMLMWRAWQARAAIASPVAPEFASVCDDRFPERTAEEHVEELSRPGMFGPSDFCIGEMEFNAPPSEPPPEDAKLPWDLTVGNGTHRKGTPLASFMARMQRLHEEAYGPMPTKEEAAANLARLQGKASTLFAGPFKPANEGRTIDDEDSPFDAQMRLDGNWESDQQRKDYAQAVCDALNDASRIPMLSDEDAQRLEREHMGDPDLKTGIYAERAEPSRELSEPSYGEMDFGYTFAGIELKDGDKRLMSLLVKAFGTDHPAVDDMAALLFRAR